MNPDPTEFPARPRHVRWQASLRQQWPVAALGVVLIAAGTFVVYGTAVDRAIRDAILGAVLLPGIGIVMIWLRAVMRFRVLLCNGEITGGITSGDGRYSFRDRSGREFFGKGATVRGAEVRIAVVFDEDSPKTNRHVTIDQFLPNR